MEQLVQKNVPNSKDLFLSLLQQISVSKSDEQSVLVNRALVPILRDNNQWLIGQTDNFASLVFFKLLRQAEEHVDNLQLREAELHLCLQIWQAKSAECKSIGREFVRIYSNVSQLQILSPILTELRKDNHSNSKQQPLIRLILNERGHLQGERNPFISSLVPIELQRKIEFMLSQIPDQLKYIYSRWMLDSAGIQFGTESESLLIDIVRFIVVNVTPPNEIIQSNILQRFSLIGHLIQQSKVNLYRTWVLQALFFDWLFYDEHQSDSIMLVEPGMLLIYRNAETRPAISDMLIEYLDNYARNYEPNRQEDALLSVQRVLNDCERKGVVKSIKDGLINNPKLKPQSQSKIKNFYRASQMIEERARSKAGLSQSQQDPSKPSFVDYQNMQFGSSNDPMGMMQADNAGGLVSGAGEQSAFDSDDKPDSKDNQLIGSFSPPHEPALLPSSELHHPQPTTFIDDQYASNADNQQDRSGGMQSYQVDRSFSQSYNIDLFDCAAPHQNSSASQNEQAPAQDVEMSESPSSEISSGDSSDDDSGSSSSQQAPQPRSRQLDVPESVIKRFFSSEQPLVKFFQKGSKPTFTALIEDVCKTYKMSEESQQEMTELAFILYERQKTVVHVWVAECLQIYPTYCPFLTCLAFCLVKFDNVFLPKLLLHSLKPKEELRWAQSLLHLLNQNKPQQAYGGQSQLSAGQQLVQLALQQACRAFELELVCKLTQKMLDCISNSIQLCFTEICNYATPALLQQVLLGLTTHKYQVPQHFLLANNFAELPQSSAFVAQRWWQLTNAIVMQSNDDASYLLRASSLIKKQLIQSSQQTAPTNLLGFHDFTTKLLQKIQCCPQANQLLLEWFCSEIHTYRQIMLLGKSQTGQLQSQTKAFLKEYTKVFVVCFVCELQSTESMDFVLGTLIEHTKECDESVKQGLYSCFEGSPEVCLKTCQQIFKSQLARSFIEQTNRVKQSVKTSLIQFSEY